MFFSVITPIYNGECFIDAYIKCLEDQDFFDWESIIVDDHSTDNSFFKFKSLTELDSRFSVFQSPAGLKKEISGPYQARNLAIKKARGQFICFLDIDDSWPSTKLSHYHSLLSENKRIDLVYSDYRCYDPDRNISFYVKQPPYIDPRIVIHFANPVPMLTACIRTELASNYTFSPIQHEDYLYWREIIPGLSKNAIYHIPMSLANYRMHSNSLTSNKCLSFIWLCNVYIFAGVKYLSIPLYLVFNILFRFYRLIYSRHFLPTCNLLLK